MGVPQSLLAGLAGSLLLAAAAPALAQPSTEPSAVTQHRITVAGKPLAYTAEAGRIAIRDAETGEPRGWMYYTAYRVASPAPRPVTFVWNGGPGANSATLHLEVAGPRRAEGAGLVDNQETWLTATDLVFVDPIGTGFSRPAKAEYADEFYGTLGDVASVTEFVRAWRLLHGAEACPTYLIGESWGAGRAANVGHALLKRGVPVDGLVLISGGSGLSRSGDAATVAALRVVSLAATALRYGKLAPDIGADAVAVQKAAERWARETYAPALANLDRLTPEEREQIATGLARFTGLPIDKIDRKTLVVTPRQFRTQLVAGKTLNIFDMRISDEPRGPSRSAVAAYFRTDLGYRTDLPYAGIEDLDNAYTPGGKPPQSVGARWDYATAVVTPEQRQAVIAEAVRTGAGPPSLGPPMPGTAEAVELNPKIRVLVAQGLYDSLANCAGAVETARTLPPAVKAAMSVRCYPGGHMMYRDTPTRLQLSRDIRALVTGGQLPQ